MLFIAHRINTIKELKNVPSEYGVELDLRDYGKRLVVTHDPFTGGEDFEKYLKHCNQRLMILNVKSERIEFRVRELLKKYRVKNYFFLDSSFPMIVALSKAGEKNVAVRFSEFESIDTVLSLKGKINWVWIDCFTKLPLARKAALQLRKAGFKLCLVSPELQGRPEDIVRYRRQLRAEKIEVDAICTKIGNIAKWQ